MTGRHVGIRAVKVNIKAVLSFVLAVLSLMFVYVSLVAMALSIVGFVIGLFALWEMRSSLHRGKGLAIAGVIINAVSFMIPIVLVVLAYFVF
ncbi:DUF4190 domain-containing protein [Salipaludibacillus agaradhaerens]|jgi:hypothetical protein|uniref:DUF4190 domain-containing protein n=1 Tax=Salipaludibacillus agaradhaerens TaxID=76935 RepID=UPI0009967A0A|nr:DUF4190 domain-containing protein [Salipaludibacillus agaradhaerens]